MPLMQKLRALLFLMRPIEWSKTFGGMVFGSLMALFLAYGFVDFSFSNIAVFVGGFAALVLLWGGLYALNDVIDYKQDRLHNVKQDRPIPSGAVSPELALFFALLLIILSFFLGYFLNNSLLLLCIGAMVLNQILYSVPPIQLKTKPLLDLVSGSMVNPYFRFYSGWVLFQQNFNAPLLFIVFIVGFQLSGFVLYRLGSKEHEKELKYNSSIVVFRERQVKALAYISGGIALLSFLFMCLSSFLFPSLVFLGSLPVRFLALVVLSSFAVPLYYHTIRHPTKMDIKKMYGMLYWHYIAFVVGFILLFVLF